MSAHLRCRHCRGFYDAELPQCRYCGKSLPIKNADGTPRLFPDRETCRSIQIAEYEQLPPEAHDDFMRPDPELLEKLCYCLHCGHGRQLFEAIEMRWMANEKKWACPCTTCGGRGFSFDIHLAERLWQCAQCDHWYTPPNGDFRNSNAKCPKCGSTNANGWFDDETDEEDDAALEEYADLEAAVEQPSETVVDDPPPWSPEQDEPSEFLGADEKPPMQAMQDDIDFPRDSPKRSADGSLPGEDDIPW